MRAQTTGSVAKKRGESLLSPILVAAYRFRACRPIVRQAIAILEGGDMYSSSLRKILQKYYQVEVGMYSYGPCLKPGVLPPGTTIGRYSSFAEGISIFRRNHPKERISTHPFFYNHILGFLSHDTIPSIEANPLHVGHDVWIGFNATILPGCHRIGNGAIIGAGSVVTKDVPEFSVVAGNPAKLIGLRFPPETTKMVAQSEWWSKSIEELLPAFKTFAQPLNLESATLLAQKPNSTAL